MYFERTPRLLLLLGCCGTLFLLSVYMVALGQETAFPETNGVTQSDVDTLRKDHNERLTCTLNRIQAKQELVHLLIQDRLTLQQVAESFLELLKSDTTFRRTYPAPSELESCAKSILNYVQAELELGKTEKAQQVQARIQQQYRELFGCESGDSPLARE